MRTLASSNDIGPKLLEALGVPSDRCVKAVITIEVGQPVLVHVKYYAETSDGIFPSLGTDEYKLVRK